MTRTARIEGRVQIGIMLLMGGLAGAASFTHIHDLAVAYGQPSWIGWADAVVVELMSIVSGLEIRRRKRARPKQSTRFVYLVFFIAVLISLAAQVAKAHPSPWGWVMAALPALGFLAVVKIIMTRQPTISQTAPHVLFLQECRRWRDNGQAILRTVTGRLSYLLEGRDRYVPQIGRRGSDANPWMGIEMIDNIALRGLIKWLSQRSQPVNARARSFCSRRAPNSPASLTWLW